MYSIARQGQTSVIQNDQDIRFVRSTWLHLLVWCVLAGIFALVLASLPLSSSLGYEFSLILAFFGSIMGSVLGAFWPRRQRDKLAGAGLEIANLVKIFWVTQIPLAIALLIICINGLRVNNCDWTGGALFFLALPMWSTLLFTVLGTALGLAVLRRWLLITLLVIGWLVLLIYAGVWFRGNPSVQFFNIAIGYFPGNLYDEAIELNRGFWWSRVFQTAAVFAIFFITLAHFDKQNLDKLPWRRRRPLIFGMFLLLVAIGLRVRGDSLGFAVTAKGMASALGGAWESEHFVIYYPQDHGDIASNISLIAEDHEFHLSQVCKTLGLALPNYKITSFYFADPEQKQALMGARDVYMAKPWRREIYINHMDFPHQVVRHEIAHVIAGEFGDPLFHVSAKSVLGLPLMFNVGLIEGIAVASDWPDHFTRDLTPHESVKALRIMGMAPPVRNLLSSGFLSFSAARSYTVSGSFVRFLLDTYGAEKLRVLYRTGGDFGQAYGRDEGELVGEWNKFIDAIVLPTGTEEIVRERFRKTSVFDRPCPHAVALGIRQVEKLFKQGHRSDGLDLLKQVCADSGNDPSFRLQLAKAYVAVGQIQEGQKQLTELAADTKLSSTLRANAALELAELSVNKLDYPAATATLKQADALPLENDLRRNIRARMFALQYKGLAGPALRQFFWGQLPGQHAAFAVFPAILQEPNLGMGYYLLGRNSSDATTPWQITEWLAQALKLGLPDPLLNLENASQLARFAYITEDDARLNLAASILAQSPSTVQKLLAKDWLERAAWRKQRSGKTP